MNTLFLVLALILGVLLAIFSTQNTAPVSLRFLGWRTDSFPLALVILAAAIVGLAMGYLLSLRGRVQRSLASRRQSRRIRDLEEQPGTGLVDQSSSDDTNTEPAAGVTRRI